MKNILSVIALCLLSASCNQSPSATDYAKEQSADSVITIKVKEAILTDNSLSPSNRFVSVTTTHGVVVLTGNVSSKEQIEKIVRKAKSVSGVKKVDNQIVLSDPES